MSDDRPGGRIYGAADAENRQSAPEQGLRGEQSARQPPRTDLTHTIAGSDGPIEIQEQSGTAGVEAQGGGGTAAAMPADCDDDSATATRDAGAENIRDNGGRAWDAVDEGSDESFPASDPPSYGGAD